MAQLLWNGKYENPIDEINKGYTIEFVCAFEAMKKPRTKMKALTRVSEDLAFKANSRRGYWFVTRTIAVNIALTKERLIHSGFYDLANAYQSVHVNY